ncbi:MAG: hypothetical protein QXQ02_00115 [Halobacteria archaeon]
MSQINLNEDFYDHVKRIADTETQDISADVVARVMKCVAEYLKTLPADRIFCLMAEWLRSDS